MGLALCKPVAVGDPQLIQEAIDAQPNTSGFLTGPSSCDCAAQETVEQLGPVSPPITGPTPATVPGQTQLSEANTAVRDDGLPGGRGLVRLPTLQPYYPPCCIHRRAR